MLNAFRSREQHPCVCGARGAGCGVSLLQLNAINRDTVAHDRVALPQSEYN